MSAKLLDVASLERPIVFLGPRRKAGLFRYVDIVIGLGTVAAGGIFLAAAIPVAAWFIRNSLASSPGAASQTAARPVLLVSISPKRASAAGEADLPSSLVTSAAVVEPAVFADRWAGAIDQIEPSKTRPTASLRITVARAEQHDAPQHNQSRSTLSPDPTNHTAIYDIAAHTVYLPDGSKLEAHSGLGGRLDDPHFVDVKDEGPTPPNTYNLALREQLFHGIPAIRLNPVDDSTMFGRNGILAHPYLTSANGESNGCVSFKDYPAFLHAYLSGEINRLVVVPHLTNTARPIVSSVRDLAGKYAANNP
jgi:hypothetical protein